MTATDVAIYEFEGTKLRTVSHNGQPWFIAADACRCLGLMQHPKHGYSQHFRKLADDEIIPTSAVGKTLEGPGMHNARLISESGLYKLIMRSDKPAARKFQDWVTRDVLPAIRKDGMYVKGEEKVATGEMSEDELVLKAMTLLQKKVERLTAENAVMHRELHFVTLDEWRALTHRYLSHGMKVKIGLRATAIARHRNLPVERQERTLKHHSGNSRVVTINVYPREVLDEAYAAVSA